MDEQTTQVPQPANPRRRKRSRFEIFKEAYLPAIIVGAGLLLILIFVIGSIVRGVQCRNIEAQVSYNASVAAQEEADRQRTLAASLLSKADALASLYEYAEAAAVLEQFDGDITLYPEIPAKQTQYAQAESELVLWRDHQAIVNLSFQMLIADPERAFNNADYGSSYKRNFITTEEFHRVLEQLYENGYILVSTEDILTKVTDENGAVRYAEKELYLPAGKKPLLLTQTNVNYNLYMVDSDGDKVADKNGAGFAHKLLIDDNGNIAAAYIDPEGETVTGAYDLVPILDSFIATHPDFSYRGAKAILALSGYDGLFGYRTDADAQEYLSAEAYSQEIESAKKVGWALRESGYELACYTYDNVPFGVYAVSEINADLLDWGAECVPILGDVDILVFAKDSDITEDTAPYTNDKFKALQAAGFNMFLGFSAGNGPWMALGTDHVRQGRILVSGEHLEHNATWYSGILDPSYVLSARN